MSRPGPSNRHNNKCHQPASKGRLVKLGLSPENIWNGRGF